MKNTLSILILLFLLVSCSEDRKFVNIALKKGKEVYVVPFMADKNIIEHQLSKNETPTIFKFVQIVMDNGSLYVEPSNFERIFNVIAGNYILYKKEEKTHDGYVAFGDEEIYSFSLKPENTDKIGEQINKEVITITNTVSNKSHEIVYVRFPKPKAEKNCIVKNLWVVENPYPGKTIGSYKDAILINLNDIVDFYDNGTRLEYNKADEMLYIIQ
ncbi:MAG: hypothetical protein RIM83_18315 [Allomuricauda sp.]